MGRSRGCDQLDLPSAPQIRVFGDAVSLYLFSILNIFDSAVIIFLYNLDDMTLIC